MLDLSDLTFSRPERRGTLGLTAVFRDLDTAKVDQALAEAQGNVRAAGRDRFDAVKPGQRFDPRPIMEEAKGVRESVLARVEQRFKDQKEVFYATLRDAFTEMAATEQALHWLKQTAPNERDRAFEEACDRGDVQPGWQGDTHGMHDPAYGPADRGQPVR